jgi:hypothetical protein
MMTSLEQIQKMMNLSAKCSATEMCFAEMPYFAEARNCFVGEDLHLAKSKKTVVKRTAAKKTAVKKFAAKRPVQTVVSPTAISLLG